MKNLRLVLTLLMAWFVIVNVSAKKKGEIEKTATPDLVFEDINVMPTTSVKNQYRTGTCWAFSALSFLESEMLRLGKPEVDLSEMFVVWHAYSDKALKDIRLHGNMSFSGGGAFHDVINVVRKYGIVPDSIYDGLYYGETKHVHGEMDRVLKEEVDAVVKNDNHKLSTAWHNAFDATLDSYLGEIPATFEYKGKEYTPQRFARDFVGLDMDNYIEIGSYTHHPFYTRFILEVPDNWAWGEIYNVPINEMQEIIDNSLANGYTVAWASDVSEKGFLTGKLGIAVVNEAGLESNKEEATSGPSVDLPDFTETTVTQEMRQAAFDDYQTTDDHGMQIVGTATAPNGEVFYKVKNSWGNYNKYNGYFYATKSYVDYKTTCIMVNKEAIPKNIRKKLNL